MTRKNMTHTAMLPWHQHRRQFCSTTVSLDDRPTQQKQCLTFHHLLYGYWKPVSLCQHRKPTTSTVVNGGTTMEPTTTHRCLCCLDSCASVSTADQTVADTHNHIMTTVVSCPPHHMVLMLTSTTPPLSLSFLLLAHRMCTRMQRCTIQLKI